jgi:hypothetical protein
MTAFNSSSTISFAMFFREYVLFKFIRHRAEGILSHPAITDEIAEELETIEVKSGN